MIVSMEDVVNEKHFHRFFCSRHWRVMVSLVNLLLLFINCRGSMASRGSREPGSVEMMSVSTNHDVFKISRGVR